MNRPRQQTARTVLAGLLALGVLIPPAAPVLAADAAPEPLPASEPATAPAADSPAPVPPAREPGAPAEAPRLVEPKISREEAIARAREQFNIPAELGDPSIHLWQSSDPGSQPTWNLSWSTPPDAQPVLRYDIGIDALTGEIRHYSFSRQAEEQPPLSYTRAEAAQLAAEWLQKLAAGYAGELQLRENQLTGSYFYGGAPAVYTFQWERLAGGFPVLGQGVTIAIDARTGELTQFNLSWNREQTFKQPTETVGVEAATQAYREQLKLGLVYRRFWDPATNKPEWKLVYSPVGGYPVVDAATGQLLDLRGQPADLRGWDDLRRLPIPPRGYQAPEQPLTQDQALALALAVTGLDRPPSRVNYSEQSDPFPRQTYMFGWEMENPAQPRPGERSYDVSVDAIRGVVQHFGSWGPEPPPEERDEAAAMPMEKAREVAERFLVTHRPDLVPNLREMPADEWQYNWCRLPGAPREEGDERPLCNRYSFRYQQMHNGIPLQDGSVMVEVDPWGGQVAYFGGGEGLNPEEMAQLPDPAGAIPAGAALEQLLAGSSLRPSWQVFWQEYHIMSRKQGGPVEPPQPVLVYALSMPDGFSAIDALTGHLLDHQGQDLNLLALEARDISGHPAQKEIELLLLRRVLSVEADGHFYPDRGVTRGEAARWLVLAKGLRPYVVRGAYSFMDLGRGGDAPAAQSAAVYAETALRAGIVAKEELGENFEPDRAVTREEFALWAVRAMGYGAVARMDVTIPLSYTDAGSIGERYRNAVALLAGLKVIDREGAFRPQETITRAEAAQILFAVASEVRER